MPTNKILYYIFKFEIKFVEQRLAIYIDGTYLYYKLKCFIQHVSKCYKLKLEKLTHNSLDIRMQFIVITISSKSLKYKLLTTKLTLIL